MSLVTVEYFLAQSYATTSQGSYTVESNVVNTINYTGQGVNIAVVDIGFDVNNTDISPNIVNYTSFRFDNNIAHGNIDHGTKVAEIILDVAPDANLYLYNYYGTTSFVNMVDHIIDRGDIDVISMSLSRFGPVGPFNGTSETSLKVKDARDNGIIWVNSAGNYAERHWNGTFTSLDSDGWHDFATDETIDITANTNSLIRLQLTWDDPWGSSNNDYDLYLFNSTIGPVASSTTVQSGTQNPIETISYNVTSSPGTYHVAIYNSSATISNELELFSIGVHKLDQQNQVKSSSITIPADSQGAITVGAVNYNTELLKDYSSQGPTNDGRLKPDVVGPTDVITSIGTFGGTSAAAPHVAGVSALIKQAYPYYTADQIQEKLELTTKDYNVKNNQNGTGLINAVNAMPFAFSDTFESDLSKWTEINELDWNIQGEAELDVPDHGTSNNVAHVDDCDTYCILQSTVIDLSDYVDAQLSFWRYIDNSVDADEYLKVEISNDNGTNWNEVFLWTNDTGNDDTWYHETHSLDSSYLTGNFIVQFNASASSFVEDIEIDDVIISETLYTSPVSTNQTIISEDFSGDMSNWTLTWDSDEWWNIATPSPQIPDYNSTNTASTTTFTVDATDPEGDAIIISILDKYSNMPDGSVSVTDHTNGTATITVDSTRVHNQQHMSYLLKSLIRRATLTLSHLP